MKFTIRAGQHYSDRWVHRCLSALQLSRELSYSVRFEESCLYRFDGVDQLDVNKLYGFSTGLNHHWYSARFGWRSTLSGKIQLAAYCYIAGNRVIQDLLEVTPEETIYTAIRDLGKSYEFSVQVGESETHITGMHKEKEPGPGYRLWPYFGGNRTAPHKMSIWLC